MIDCLYTIHKLFKAITYFLQSSFWFSKNQHLFPEEERKMEKKLVAAVVFFSPPFLFLFAINQP